ncbi:proteasome regulatory particle subunit, partial [Coemansia asiatica]
MELDYATNEPKMEKDYSESVNQLLPEIEQLVGSGNLNQALEKLHALEKKSRSAADLWSTTKLVETIVDICGNSGEWVLLEQEVTLLAKKHGQLKQAISKMIQRAMTYVEKTTDEETRVQLIESLRKVTEGKIH